MVSLIFYYSFSHSGIQIIISMWDYVKCLCNFILFFSFFSIFCDFDLFTDKMVRYIGPLKIKYIQLFGKISISLEVFFQNAVNIICSFKELENLGKRLWKEFLKNCRSFPFLLTLYPQF